MTMTALLTLLTLVLGDLNWTSDQATTDHDTDGCQDSNEDTDDDNDSVADAADDCPAGDLGWTSDAGTDHGP